MDTKRLKATMWAYPWDMTAIGKGRFLDLIESAGMTGISMATAYHAGLFVTPHHPHHRLYFPEDGVLYFRPTQGTAEQLSLQPRLSSLLEAGEPLRDTINEAHSRGIEVNSWFVCTHNTDLGMRNPDVVLRTAYGDPLYYGLCPANPKVAEYLVALLSDLSRAHAIDAIDAESLGFLGYPHGYHHEKDLLGLSEKAGYLLSICFCKACLRKARETGIDGERVRRVIRGKLDAIFEGGPGIAGEGDSLAAIASDPRERIDDPEVQAYLQMRVDVVMDLIRSVKASLRKGCRLQLIEWNTPDKWWMYGFDQGLGEVVDGMIMCCYDRDTSYLERLIKESRNALPNAAIIGGIQAGYPTCSSPADVHSQLSSVRSSGADGVQVYHFGLIRRRNLEWLKAGLSESR